MHLSQLFRSAVALGASAIVVSAAQADFKKLISRLPGEANTIVVIDVDKLMASEMGQADDWKSKRAAACGERPVLVPPGTSRVVWSALIDPTTMETQWEVATMDLESDPSMPTIAKAEGGAVDTLGDKAAVWSPVGAYFIRLDAKMLGVVSPANRQFASRWAQKKQTLEGAFISPYLQAATRAVEGGADFAMVIDLEDCTFPQRVKQRIIEQPLQALNGKKFDVDALAKLVASVKGVTLRVDVAKEATGRCSIDFGQDAALLNEFGKAVFLELLADMGASIPDFTNWQATIKGKSLVLEGKLSIDGLRRLLSVVDTPAPSGANQAQAADAGGAAAGDGAAGAGGGAQVMAAASQEYYKSVTTILEKLQKQINTGSQAAAMSDCCNWMKRDARKITRLPIMNVDPDLLAWGNEISNRLMQAADVFASSALQAKARSAGVYQPNLNAGDQTSADWGNYHAARTQAATEEKARATETAGQIFREIQAVSAKIRTVMVDRYKAQF